MFLKWLKQVLIVIGNNKKAHDQVQLQKHKMRVSVWKVLQQAVYISKAEQRVMQHCRFRHSESLASRVFSAWAKQYLPEQRVKSKLFACLEQERNRRTA